jgi:L-alanine-DL-glutamate epimerase-like enolase superfamily enzyme
LTQTVASPSITPGEIAGFLEAHRAAGVATPAFLEEIQGPDDISRLPDLRKGLGVPLAGGEIVTTPSELVRRIAAGCYDIAQPDATVIGGVGPVMAVFEAARAAGVAVYVHCWGAGVGMLANYHAALAGGGRLVEWPMPPYPLRAALLGDLTLRDGFVHLPDAPGLDARLSAETEAGYPFRPEAVYRCLAPAAPDADWR